MGEVYRAHDARLGRDVAIKVLPPHLSATPEVRARFEREARTISQLNHPHICTLHDVGRDADTDYLVMELVEGETLAQRLQKGPLPTADLLRIGVQIADALDRAHHAGVVHRDLKPGNVMLSKDGAKLLDFGLARAAGLGDATAGQTDSPTMSSPITAEGTIVGTVQYMAPEQLEGKEADARTDLFALGTMLYEMATGKKAFEGKSQASLIAAIMEREPTPLSQLVPLAPSALERVVKRCMAKDPDERWQTARDLTHELKWMLDDSSAATTPRALGAPLPGRRARAPRRALWIGGAAVIVVVAAGMLLLPKGPPRLNPGMTFRTLQLPFVEINYPGMSSDGKWIALPATDGRGRWVLYFMNLGGGEPREIVTAEAGTAIQYADVSPDGSQVAYEARNVLQNRNMSLVVPSLGGAPRVVAQNGLGPHWSPDGKRVGYQLVGNDSRSGKLELWSVRAEGGDSRLEFVDSLSTGGNRYCFAWSPDGKQVVWTRGFNSEQSQELVVRTLATGAERQLTRDGAIIDEVWWTRQNEIVFSSNRAGNTNLWMIRASGGSPAQITKGVGPDVAMRVSADGKTLLYLQRQFASNVWIADLHDGRASQVTHDDRVLGIPALSPDHRQLLVPALEPDPLRRNGTIEVMNREGADRRTLVSGLVNPQGADWSPDGRWIAYSACAVSMNFDSMAVFVTDPSGVTPRRVGTGFRVQWVDDSTLLIRHQSRSLLVSSRNGVELAASTDSTVEQPMRDGGSLVMDTRRGREGWWARPSAAPAGTTAAPLFIAPISVNAVATSRDGSFLLCVPEVGKAAKIHIPSGRREPVPGTFPGLTPQARARLSADGRELVYLAPAVSSKLVLIENLR